MQTTSDLFKTILNNPLRVVQNKVTIAGTDYFDDKIESLSVYGSMFSSDSPCIGSAVSRTIKVTLKTDGAYIQRAAKIKVFIRLALLDSTGHVTSASEWIPKGVFYIDTRQPDEDEQFLTINGYDAMLKGEQPLVDQAAGETETWPKTMREVASACAEKMGVEIDPSTIISDDYEIGYPTDYTCRELLRHIAAAHGGNWTISDEGKLRFIVLGNLDSFNPIQLGREVSDFSAPPAFAPFSRLTLWLDDEIGFTSGDDSGRSIEADCPWATQEMCDAVLAAIGGYQYVPYTATDALIDPAAEISDSVVVNGKFSVIASMDATLGPLYTATISAPADEEIDHEFPYKPQSSRAFNRKIAQTKSEIMVKMDSIVLRVTDASGVTSEIKLTEAGKIDLTGYATFQGLSDGTTVIDGGCIKADSKIESPLIVGGTIYAGTPENMLGYLKMVNDGLEVYNKDGLLKARIGYTSSDLDYPYIQLGSGNSSGVNSQGVVKKFVDGLWIGNGAALEASGNFAPQDGYNGIFVKFSDGQTYVVKDTAMQNVYTGDSIARFG